MSEVGHVHEWRKPAVYRDFCHYTLIEKTCKECGIVNVDSAERDFDLNPLQIAFADEGCYRCRELLDGEEPPSWAHRPDADEAAYP